MLSNEELKNIEEASMFRFTEEEKDEIKVKFQESLERVEKLLEVDTEGVAPLYRVYDYNESLREDKVDKDKSLAREDVLKNTKEQQYGYFKLLNIMD